MDKSTSLDPAVFEVEKAGAQGLPNVHFFDFTDSLCESDVCKTVRNGAVMYRDNHHLTGSFASTLAPILEAKLLSIMNTPPSLMVKSSKSTRT